MTCDIVSQTSSAPGPIESMKFLSNNDVQFFVSDSGMAALANSPHTLSQINAPSSPTYYYQH